MIGAEAGNAISLRPVTLENVRVICALEVAPHQRHLVAPNAISLAQAGLTRKAWPRAIYAGEEPVGFLMLADDTLEAACAEPKMWLWRFRIDARHKRSGHGAQALALAIAHARTRPGVDRLLLSDVPSDGSADGFYSRFKFVATGRVDDGELEMELRFDDEPNAADDRAIDRIIARTVRADVREQHGYVVAPATGMVKLDAMENPYRLADDLDEAARAGLARALLDAPANRYPLAGNAALRRQIAAYAGVPDGFEVLLGNGSDELIDIVCKACAQPGASVLSPWPSFVMYRNSALLNGLRFTGVPLSCDATGDFTLDRAALLAAIAHERPSVVFISYPNNPTGGLFDTATLEAVLAAAPGLVVIDEAYQAFSTSTFMPRLAEFDNLVVMRTLSKAGLAGLRLGYMAGPSAWIREFDKVRPPYNINVLTETYASFALEHRQVLDHQAAAIRSERAALADLLARWPQVRVFGSQANFLLIRVPAAEAVFDSLRSRKVLVKSMSGAHPLLADCLRITVSTPEENRRFIEAFAAALSPSASRPSASSPQ
ncbi:hypothetical protein BH09PSE6_BH09PSE6_17370 [soil metagenome]